MKAQVTFSAVIDTPDWGEIDADVTAQVYANRDEHGHLYDVEIDSIVDVDGLAFDVDTYESDAIVEEAIETFKQDAEADCDARGGW